MATIKVKLSKNTTKLLAILASKDLITLKHDGDLRRKRALVSTDDKPTVSLNGKHLEPTSDGIIHNNKNLEVVSDGIIF